MNQLDAMRTFMRVAELGSFAAVANQLGTVRSVVTRQVAALEEHLGVKLMVRSTRSLTLTSAGAAYLDKCRAILDMVDAAGANLDGSQFRDLSFAGACLEGASLRLCTFKGCLFHRCDLRRADLRGAIFVSCDFNLCDASDARVDKATTFHAPESWWRCRRVGWPTGVASVSLPPADAEEGLGPRDDQQQQQQQQQQQDASTAVALSRLRDVKRSRGARSALEDAPPLHRDRRPDTRSTRAGRVVRPKHRRR